MRWPVLVLALGGACDPADAWIGEAEVASIGQAELVYSGELRTDDLVSSMRSFVTIHEGVRGWPRLWLLFTEVPTDSLAGISYDNFGLDEEDEAWVKTGKWRYDYDEQQQIEDFVVSDDRTEVEGQMTFLGVRLRGIGSFVDDGTALDLRLQADLLDPADIPVWMKLGRMRLELETEDAG